MGTGVGVGAGVGTGVAVGAGTGGSVSVGVGVGPGVGAGVGPGVGAGVGPGVGAGVRIGLADGLGLRMSVGLVCGVDVGIGVGVASSPEMRLGSITGPMVAVIDDPGDDVELIATSVGVTNVPGVAGATPVWVVLPRVSCAIRMIPATPKSRADVSRHSSARWVALPPTGLGCAMGEVERDEFADREGPEERG